jgi:hypothetical protein
MAHQNQNDQKPRKPKPKPETPRAVARALEIPHPAVAAALELAPAISAPKRAIDLDPAPVALPIVNPARHRRARAAIRALTAARVLAARKRRSSFLMASISAGVRRRGPRKMRRIKSAFCLIQAGALQMVRVASSHEHGSPLGNLQAFASVQEQNLQVPGVIGRVIIGSPLRE